MGVWKLENRIDKAKNFEVEAPDLETALLEAIDDLGFSITGEDDEE